MTMRELNVIRQGSRIFPYSVPAVNHTVTVAVDIGSLFPVEAQLWDYFDSLVILNNSALPVHFYLNCNKLDDYYILPYGTQPITRRAFRSFSFYNPDGALDIAAGLISMQMRRLPPDAMSVVNQS